MATGNSDLLVMCCMFRWNYGGITEITTNAKWLWKCCLMSGRVLRFPKFNRAFFIHANACDLSHWAALMQMDYNDCCYFLCKPFSIPRKKCLTFICAREYFRPYIKVLYVTRAGNKNFLSPATVAVGEKFVPASQIFFKPLFFSTYTFV